MGPKEVIGFLPKGYLQDSDCVCMQLENLGSLTGG